MVYKIVLVLVFLVLLYSIVTAVAFINIALVRKINSRPIVVTDGPRALYSKRMQESADWFMAMNPREVTITSFDGLKLHAYYLPVENSKGTVLLMHGYHSSGLRDFACIYDYLHTQGYTVLLPDQRAHGESEGKYLTFGVRERFDCRDWITWLNNRSENLSPLWLMGISMGSSTVMFAAGFDLPKNVKGIIADCGYTRPREIIKRTVFRDYHIITWTMLPVANILSKIFCGFGMRDASTKKALATNTVPIMFVHGTNDTFVPYKMSLDNYTLCQAPKQMLTTQSVHALSFVTATDLYKKTLDEFMQTYK